MSLIRRAGRRALKLVGRGPHQAPPVMTFTEIGLGVGFANRHV